MKHLTTNRRDPGKWILKALTPAAQIWIDDGKLGARVVSVAPSRAVLEVVHVRDRSERLRAVGQRAGRVMLNKGPHLIDAIAFLDDVLRRMDRHQYKKSARLGSLGSWSEPQTL